MTKNGKYNDDSGNAYLISYYSDGTIRTLYKGRMANGNYNDDTWAAWYISSEKDKNVNYLYFKGGSPKRGKIQGEEAINDVSYYKVMEFVKGELFEKDLNWDMHYMMQ